ncbi:MAG: N-acetyl-gamma-glutamyl-phosphate reductase [Spirochaetaceae bacterium]
MKAAVLGATGYGGLGVLALLAEHPDVDQVLPVSSSQPGTALGSVYPGLSPTLLEKTREARLLDMEEARRRKPDVVFSALPHLKSAEVCAPFFESTVVIDLSADFRIPDPALFERAYGVEPPREDLLERSTYGLTEWFRARLRNTDLIANPGCYPTATLLPLLPLLHDGLVSGPITVNAMSGISGAGRKAAVNLLFTERSENVNAYAPGTSHRHWAEIYHYAVEAAAAGREKRARSRPSPTNDRPSSTKESTMPAGGGHQEAGPETGPEPASKDLEVLFTPHLVPIKRGIAVTSTCRLTAEADADTVARSLRQAYDAEPFVGLSRRPIPETRDVRASNRCDIGYHVEGAMLLLFSVIDNLEKGAAGQAVQNMNVRFGFQETAGLPLRGEY